MPLYEYHCKNCGEQTELLQKLSDTPEKTCPACHKDTLEKQISSSNFQLKGSGWYVTDFRDKQKPDVSESTQKPNASESAEKPVVSESANTQKPPRSADDT